MTPGGTASTQRAEASFDGFNRVVLVGNSDEGRAALSRIGAEEDTLFVFFNKTYKVLDSPFLRPALLVARSSAAGANIVYRREVRAVLEPFAGTDFRGVLNLRVSSHEALSPPEAFGGVRVAHLDLAGKFSDFYPDGFVPTSGFALALWLVEQMPHMSVRLAGFSARRSARWKLFRDHDWTFEQTAMRLLHRAGQIELVGADRGLPAIERFARRFPGLDAREVAAASDEVLARRIDNLESSLDRVISQMRPLETVRGFLRRLKPATRKQKLAAKRHASEEASNPLAKPERAD